MTGRLATIVSSGTMPKCSNDGVYTTAVHSASIAFFSASENDRTKRTWLIAWGLAAAAVAPLPAPRL
jgi:hypothetical protein